MAEAPLLFPTPQANALLASLADIFPSSPRFLLFSPNAEPGPRLGGSVKT